MPEGEAGAAWTVGRQSGRGRPGWPLELGVKMVQFHKGFPLELGPVEAFRPNDIQHAAADFPELNSRRSRSPAASTTCS